jgi:putative RecB family exonuclease
MTAAHIKGTGDDKLPRALSPSRASDFAMCPAKYFLGGIQRLREPAKDYLLIGTAAHYAYEVAFDLPAGERTPESVVPFVDVELQRMREAGEDLHLIGTDEGMKAIGDVARQMVVNWFSVERPNNFEPIGREIAVRADLGGGCKVFGIIDRLDRVEFAGGDVAYMISDYKTGKVPSASSRYLDEKFFQLRTYGLALHETINMDASKLRLIYTKRGRREDVRTRPFDAAVRERTRTKVLKLWDGITTAAENEVWPCKVQKLCDWCSYQPECPAFNAEFDDGNATRIAESFRERVAAMTANETPLETPVTVGASPTVVSETSAFYSSDELGVVGLDSAYTGNKENW